MNSELEVFDARLKALQPQLQSASTAVERMRADFDAAREELARIQGQVELLHDLRKQVIGVSKPRGARRPTTAIRNLVAQRPGITMGEILNQLDGTIDTVSSNERHILRTTLTNMVKSGKLERHDGDRFSVPNHR